MRTGTRTVSRIQAEQFQKFIWDFYAQHGRSFSWREQVTPYRVFVSEVMLQQTQTSRVETKFEQFMDAFPTFEELAEASLAEVLRVWQGMGYNRRGKFLHQSACIVAQEYNGLLPEEPEELVNFPGIGKATAASIAAFAFNKPTVFIETNIRAVFIHTFFKDRVDVYDNELMPLIAATVDQLQAREWYYALMDYGVMLKSRHKNPSRKSKHHAKQSKFEGSDRQLRGKIIRLLTQSNGVERAAVHHSVDLDERFDRIVDQLCQEKMVRLERGNLFLGA